MVRHKEFTAERACPVCGGSHARYLRTVNSIALVRCLGCSLVYADISRDTVERSNRYGEKELIHYYIHEPVYTIAYYDLQIDKIIRHALSAFGIRPDKIRLLEFGCGSGMFLRRARMRGLQAKGIDNSRYARIAARAFNLDIIEGDLTEAGLPHEHFDAVYSHATFEHLYEPGLIARELARTVKPGGLLITASVPNYNTFSIKVLKNFSFNQPPWHVNFFEPGSLTYLYRALNLNRIQVMTHGINFWTLLYRLRALNVTPYKKKVSHFTRTATDLAADLRRISNGLDTMKTNFLHRAVALLYLNLRWYGAGQCVSAWGMKQ